MILFNIKIICALVSFKTATQIMKFKWSEAYDKNLLRLLIGTLEIIF